MQYFFKLCSFLVSWFQSFGKKYENDLRVIFDQWPKSSLGLDVRSEIPILKVIYLSCSAVVAFFINLDFIFKSAFNVLVPKPLFYFLQYIVFNMLRCHWDKWKCAWVINGPEGSFFTLIQVAFSLERRCLSILACLWL